MQQSTIRLCRGFLISMWGQAHGIAMSRTGQGRIQLGIDTIKQADA